MQYHQHQRLDTVLNKIKSWRMKVIMLYQVMKVSSKKIEAQLKTKTKTSQLTSTKTFKTSWCCSSRSWNNSTRTFSWYNLLLMKGKKLLLSQAYLFRHRKLMRLQLRDCPPCRLRKLVIIKKLWPLQRFSMRRHNKTSRWLNNSFRRWSKIKCTGPETSWCSSRSNKKMSFVSLIFIRFINIQFSKRWTTMGLLSKSTRK